MTATFATITTRMRTNFFSRNPSPQPQQPATPAGAEAQATPVPRTGKTFPADEVVWGIAIRNGFDEIDDPWYHRGTTQHAYLEGNDNVAICGFRPPQSGPRTRRRSRLGLPASGEHPMCGMCARMVVAPRPRVPIPVQPGRAPVAVPITAGVAPPPPLLAAPVAAGVAPRTDVATSAAAAPSAANGQQSVAPAQPAPQSPWVKNRSGIEGPPTTITVDLAARHDSGLLDRGVHAEFEDD